MAKRAGPKQDAGRIASRGGLALQNLPRRRQTAARKCLKVSVAGLQRHTGTRLMAVVCFTRFSKGPPRTPLPAWSAPSLTVEYTRASSCRMR